MVPLSVQVALLKLLTILKRVSFYPSGPFQVALQKLLKLFKRGKDDKEHSHPWLGFLVVFVGRNSHHQQNEYTTDDHEHLLQDG